MVRTIKGALEELKAIDPNTSVTLYAIRKMVKQNKIPYIKTGNKILINMDNLIHYIEGKELKK
mgnify:CR=1 FL=1